MFAITKENTEAPIKILADEKKNFANQKSQMKFKDNWVKLKPIQELKKVDMASTAAEIKICLEKIKTLESLVKIQQMELELLRGESGINVLLESELNNSFRKTTNDLIENRPSCNQNSYENTEIVKDNKSENTIETLEAKIYNKQYIEVCNVKLIDLILEAPDTRQSKINQIKIDFLQRKNTSKY
jgi:hypothetical protein